MRSSQRAPHARDQDIRVNDRPQFHEHFSALPNLQHAAHEDVVAGEGADVGVVAGLG